MVEQTWKSGTSPIIHLGPSRFFRGHFLPLLQAQCPGLEVTAISLRTPDARNDLEKQGYKYNLFARSTALGKDIEQSSIKNLKEIVVADEDRRRTIELLAADSTQIVTLTVTSKGYGAVSHAKADLHTGELLSEQELREASSSASVIAAALYQRYRDKKEPFVIMSLDNLPENSSTLRAAVLHYADRDPAFGTWVAANLVHIDTMVDRIVPFGDHFDPANFWKTDNVPPGPCPIYTEPLPLAALVMGPEASRYPILRALAEHPNVLISNNVAKYGEMKIRMLNGAHFALGMVGRLAGYDNSREAMQNPAIRDFMIEYIALMEKSLRDPFTKVNTSEYGAEVLARISNIYLEDPLIRIARDSYSKLQPRLIGPLVDLHKDGADHEHLDLVVAAWTQYLKRASMDPEFEIDDKVSTDQLGLLDHNEGYYDRPEILRQIEGFEGFSSIPSMEWFAGRVGTGRQHLHELLDTIERARLDPESYRGLPKIGGTEPSLFGPQLETPFERPFRPEDPNPGSNS